MTGEPSQLKNKEIFSVTELNLSAKGLLEDCFPSIWVKGEISNLARPRSGHIYFTLKDDRSQIRAAMFRGHNTKLNFDLEEGLEIFCRAKVSLYSDRGDYQLIVDKMEVSGEGKLALAFEELKKKLLKQGLFDQSNKKPLPKYPNNIAIITSPTGAAVRDIIKTLKTRYPIANLVIYPCQVQGKLAASQIKAQLELANSIETPADLIILARGGGSIEDLWSFNEEIVARAIFESDIPIISGVGHETDTTISDFVADVRAPTPTGAALMATPDIFELKNNLAQLESSLSINIKTILDYLTQKIDLLENKLVHPGHKIKELQTKFSGMFEQLNITMKLFLNNKTSRFENAARALNTISPLATLDRGYSIVTNKNNKIINKISQIKIGDKINTKLTDGTVTSVVESKI